MSSRSRGAAIALAAFLAAGLCASEAGSGQKALEALLPADGAAPGWSRDGETQAFAGEDLYVYINGGAEIYQEYGFRRVVVQDYKNSAGKSLSLEIFEMETPAAAFGMFTFKRSGQGKDVPIGSGAELEDYYLNFWKGRYLATLTGFDESAETVAGLLAVGGRVEALIPDKADPPPLVAALPGEGLRPGSVKYLRGLLGLNNVYPFPSAHGLGFAAAVKGDYGEGAFLIVLDYASDAARGTAWDELRAALEGSDKFEKTGDPAAGSMLFRDAKGRYAAFAPSGARIAIGVSADPSISLKLVSQGIRSLRSEQEAFPEPSRREELPGIARSPYWKACFMMSTRPRAYSTSVSGIFPAPAILVKRPSLLLSLVTTM